MNKCMNIKLLLLCQKNNINFCRRWNSSFPMSSTIKDDKTTLSSENQVQYHLPYQQPVLPETPIELLPENKMKMRELEIKQSIENSPDFYYLSQFYFENYEEFKADDYFILSAKLSSFKNRGLITPSIMESIELKAMCYNVWKKCTEFEQTVILGLYKNFLYLGVQSNSLLLQSLLQMMRHQINNMELQQLLFMDRLLQKTPDCKVKFALLKSIPILIENHLDLYPKMELKFFETLQLLKLCMNKRIEGAAFVLDDVLMNKIPLVLEEDNSTKAICLPNFIITIGQLCLEQNSNILLKSKGIEQTLECILQEMSKEDNIHKMQYPSTVFQLLYWFGILIQNNVLQREAIENVLYGLSNHAINENWAFDHCLKIMIQQRKLGFVFNNFILDSLHSKQNKISSLNIRSICSLVNIIASTPTVHDQFCRTKDTLIEKIEQCSPEDNPNSTMWLSIALNILSMNVVPKQLLKKILTEKFLDRYFEPSLDVKYMHLLSLIRAIEMLFPESQDCVQNVPERHLSKAIEICSKPVENSTFEVIFRQLLGRDRVASHLKSDRHSNLHHVIILDENRRPVSLPSIDSNQFKDLNIGNDVPADRRISIRVIPIAKHYLPEGTLNPHTQLDMRTLEKENFTVINICYDYRFGTEAIKEYIKEILINNNIFFF